MLTKEHFYVTFFGGGGVGALAYATPAPLVLGGGLQSVELIEGGVNYSSAPQPILGNQLTNKQFQIYTRTFMVKITEM